MLRWELGASAERRLFSKCESEGVGVLLAKFLPARMFEQSFSASHYLHLLSFFAAQPTSPHVRCFFFFFFSLSVHFQVRTALISISPSPLLIPAVFAKWRVINGDSLVGAAVCSPLCLLFVSTQENQNCRRRGARLPTDYSDCLDVS